MDLRRLRAGDWILALAGAALLASLFLPWYLTPGPGASTLSGWEALSVTDVLLALIALFVLAIPVVAAVRHVPAVPLAMEGLAFPVGVIALIVVLVRLPGLPDGAESREWAIWLALGASVAILVGSLVAMRDERLSRPGRPTDAAGVPAEPPPLPDPIPAPRG